MGCPAFSSKVWRGVGIVWLVPLLMLPVQIHAETDLSSLSGSISGEVRITRNLSAQRMRFRLYPGFKPIPPPTTAEKRDDEWQNVVIYLKPAFALPFEIEQGQELQITQLGETFIPHVLPVVQGSTVNFPNQDPIFHNVFSLSGTKTFDLGRYPKGESKSVTFNQPGIVPVFCHLHSDMSAIVMVLENPYFAVPDSKGHYAIENIPAGPYTLVAWHERSEQAEQQVEVVAGESLSLDITVPIENDEDSGP